MPVSPPSLPLTVPPSVIDRLRAAGCVFAEDEARLLVAAARTPDELAALVRRRIDGLPLEHVLGWAEFCGSRVTVTTGVFVPRPRTEFLVHQAAAGLPRPGDPSRRPVVVDLCCGSGAVGVALAAALRPDRQGADRNTLELHAVDIDPTAVRCARTNVAAVGGRVYQGDLYQPLPADLVGRVDVLVVNAPYVPTEEIELLPVEAREHEPRVALDGGADGLEVQRRVTARAARWLAPGGRLLIETSRSQAHLTVRAMTLGGLLTEVARSQEYQATVVVGTRAAGRS